MKCPKCSKIIIPKQNSMCISCAIQQVEKGNNIRFETQAKTIERLSVELIKLNNAYNDAIENNIALGKQLKKKIRVTFDEES